MVYIASWDEFVERSVQLFRSDPNSVSFYFEIRFCRCCCWEINITDEKLDRMIVLWFYNCFFNSWITWNRASHRCRLGWFELSIMNCEEISNLSIANLPSTHMFRLLHCFSFFRFLLTATSVFFFNPTANLDAVQRKVSTLRWETGS